MIIFILPLFICLILFIIYQVRNRWVFGSISLLYFTYLGMCIAAVLGLVFKFELPILPISINSMLYFSLVLILLLDSFYTFRDDTIQRICINSQKLYDFIKYFLLFFSICAILFFLPFAFNSLQGDISNNRYDQINLAQLKKLGIVNTFFSLIANCFIYAQIIGLIEISRNSKKGIFIGFGLVVSSISYYFYILSYVGRDGFVYWTMSALFSYMLMRRFILKKYRYVLISIFIILVFLISFPFLKISDSRFGNGSHSELQPKSVSRESLEKDSNKIIYIIENIVDYAGQQIVNFNDLYSINPPPRRGGENFSKITQILQYIGIDVHPIYNRTEIDEYYFKYGAVPWVFSTLIGSFVSDFGKIGTLLLALIFFISNKIFLKLLNSRRQFELSSLIIFILGYQVVYWGVFYFRLYSANLYLLVVITTYFIFKIESKSKKIYIEKLDE